MDAPRFAALLRDWRQTSPDAPLYGRLAAAFRGAIESGSLRPAEQLPAERHLAALLGVSRSTVVAAYDDLALGEWVTRRRGSGTHVGAAAPRRAEVLTLRTPAAVAQTADELDFTIAVPLLTERHRAEMLAAAAHSFSESLYYPLGLPDLRALLAERYTQGGLPTTPEQVIVTSGAQQAIALVTATFLQRGDTALLETPTYFGAIDVFRAAGAELVGVPVGAEGVRPDDFHRLLEQHRPRLTFLTPTFQNPTGAVLSAAGRQQVAQSVADLRCPTIEDDTLAELDFGLEPPPRLAAFAPDAPIINVGSLTKLYWAGLRVGWMRVPHEWHSVLVQAKTLADFGGSLPTQHIALSLLQDLPRLKAERRAEVQPARDLLAALLREQLPDWTFRQPQGGQYLWVELPTLRASSFTYYAARYGVRLFPGASMGVGDIPDSFLRLPFTLAPAHLPEAVARLRAAWQDFSSRSGQERLA
ncbi:histidinol-phosphate aminotransferase [Deinococcus xinjiangensis]|uniref:Histidinol-phosphate aminotransferase n=1 Tax=Deinococcus xinjiangensis TaxID=457454 RepID=A0ABP9V6J0_9DEIO